MDTKYKKKFGTWGEKYLDSFMEKNGWHIDSMNTRFKGGEIDRIYKKGDKERQNLDFCIAEVKTAYVHNKNFFEFIYTELGLSYFLKKNQVSNLFKYGEHLISQQNLKKYSTNIHLRIFLVLKMYNKYQDEIFFKNQTQFKICLQTKKSLLISIKPEYVHINCKKTLLQTVV